MSIYRCNQCDTQKDNDIECVYDVSDKQICQGCLDDEVGLLNDPEFAEIIEEETEKVNPPEISSVRRPRIIRESGSLIPHCLN